MGSILYSYTTEELQKLLDESSGYADVLRKVGINPNGRNSDTLKKIIKEYNLDETKLIENRKKLYSECGHKSHENTSQLYDLNDILDGKYPNYQSAKLLKRLVKAGLKELKCEICGIIDWNNKPISFQLDHINGNHHDNSFNNLRVLCPNCHSQTETYGGKSSHKNKKDFFETVPPDI